MKQHVSCVASPQEPARCSFAGPATHPVHCATCRCMPRCAKRQPVSRHATAATAAERSAWEQQASATEKLCFQMALHFLAFPRASKGSRFLHVSTVSPGAASMPAGLAAEAWTWTPLAQASADFSHTKLGQERLGLPRSTRSSAPPSARTMELVSNDRIVEEDSVPNGHIYRL